MQYRYKYVGNTEVNIPYVGTFKPGETRTVDKRIDHPDFQEVKSKKSK